MALDDYIPFDLDDLDTGNLDGLASILLEYGVTSWRELFTDIQDANADSKNLRGSRSNTPEEIVYEYYRRGLLPYIKLVYFEDDDLYGVIFNYVAP